MGKIQRDELKVEVAKFKNKDSEEMSSVEMLEKELKVSKDEFDNIIKEMHAMRKKQLGGIDGMCDNIKTMCDELRGYIKKVENNIKEMEEELSGAQETQRKLKEEIQISRNQTAQRSWADLRNGKGPSSMASMRGKRS